MPSLVKILRVVADPNRLRILLLLRDEELSVAELQEILTMGQSTISTHLSQLKQAGLVEDRRTGKNSLYRLATQSHPTPAAEEGSALKGHDFNRVSMDLRPAQGSENASAASAPEGRHENSPGRQPWVGLREEAPSPGGANEISPQIPKGTDRDFDRAENNTGLAEPSQTAEKLGAVKGTGFSPYMNSAKPMRASAPECFPSSRPQATDGFLYGLLARAEHEIPEAAQDQAAMRSVLKKRQDKMRSFFDSVAGRLGKDYVPGQSWKGVAEALLRLMPPLEIADLGAGEGAFALLLAQRATRVIAVDTSAKMIEVARDEAVRHGVKNVEYRLGDMEEVPIDDQAVDLVFFSQSLHHALHPERAIHEAARILRPGGRIVILDLVKHRFEEARELYADEWLGFSEAELEAMLEKAGFGSVQTSVVHKEPETPQFQTLLAVADKQRQGS